LEALDEYALCRAFAADDMPTLAQRCLAQLRAPITTRRSASFMSASGRAGIAQLVRDLAAGTASPPGSAGSGSASAAAGRRSTTVPPRGHDRATARDSFRLFGATDDPPADLPRQHAGWIEKAQPSLALVHADPRCTDLVQAAIDTASASGAPGSVAWCRIAATRRCSPARRRRSRQGRHLGLLLTPEVSVATALTRAASDRAGAPHRRGARQCVMAIDGRRRPFDVRFFHECVSCI